MHVAVYGCSAPLSVKGAQNYLKAKRDIKVNMALSTISMCGYIKTGSEIEARYVDPNKDDETRWYRGIVKKINKYGTSSCGKYVECDVMYDDGELVKGWRFYDEDYGEEVWRFSSLHADLIDTLVNRVRKLEEYPSEDDEEEAFDEAAEDSDDEGKADEDDDDEDDDDEDDDEDDDDEDDDDEDDDDEDDEDAKQWLDIVYQREKRLDDMMTLFSRTMTLLSFVAALVTVPTLTAFVRSIRECRVF